MTLSLWTWLWNIKKEIKPRLTLVQSNSAELGCLVRPKGAQHSWAWHCAGTCSCLSCVSGVNQARCPSSWTDSKDKVANWPYSAPDSLVPGELWWDGKLCLPSPELGRLSGGTGRAGGGHMAWEPHRGSSRVCREVFWGQRQAVFPCTQRRLRRDGWILTEIFSFHLFQ